MILRFPSHPATTAVADFSKSSCQPRLSAIYTIASTANYTTNFESNNSLAQMKPAPELKSIKAAFKSLRRRCPATPKTENVAELLAFRTKTRQKERKGEWTRW